MMDKMTLQREKLESNINSAKFFVRWILGETDGKGEGYKPFLQEGAWPARIDVEGGLI